jgi:hypothetical protein
MVRTKPAKSSAVSPLAAVHQGPRQADAAKMDQARTATDSSSIRGLSPALADFFQATNSAAVHSVMEAIESQVDRLLPVGISKSARNRVAGKIYRELNTTLQGNRALGQPMRDAFRSGGLDDAHRKAIVPLVTGRARQALVGGAKRVLNEGTNTIGSAKSRSADAPSRCGVAWTSADRWRQRRAPHGFIPRYRLRMHVRGGHFEYVSRLSTKSCGRWNFCIRRWSARASSRMISHWRR